MKRATLQAERKCRDRPVSGGKRVLAHRLAGTRPTAMHAQAHMVRELLVQCSYLQLELKDMLSVQAASTWLTAA
eukprot:11162406-Lingulodinium_polyedra.AAC.1